MRISTRLLFLLVGFGCTEPVRAEWVTTMAPGDSLMYGFNGRVEIGTALRNTNGRTGEGISLEPVIGGYGAFSFGGVGLGLQVSHGLLRWSHSHAGPMIVAGFGQLPWKLRVIATMGMNAYWNFNPLLNRWDAPFGIGWDGAVALRWGDRPWLLGARGFTVANCGECSLIPEQAEAYQGFFGGSIFVAVQL